MGEGGGEEGMWEGGRTADPQVAKGVGAALVLVVVVSQWCGKGGERNCYGVARYCLQKAEEVLSYLLIAR